MRVLITGASGFVGRHLVSALRHRHNTAIALHRGSVAGAADDIFAGPEDLADIDAWPDWPRDVEAVVHLAAVNPTRREPASPEAFGRVNVAGTASLARRARREGVRRVLFLSTANVHAPRDDRPIRETDPLTPSNDYARSKRDAELVFWDRLRGGRTEGCILRPAPVYGPSGRGTIATLAKLARLPLVLPVEGLGARRSLVAVDHLVEAIVLCLAAPDAAGETFLVADDGPPTLAEIIGAIRRGRGRRPLTPALPRPLRRLADAVSRSAPGLERLLTAFELDLGRLRDATGWHSPMPSVEKLASEAAQNRI